MVKRNLDGYMNLNGRHIKMEKGFRGDLSPVLSWESNKFSLTRKGESSVIVVIHRRKKIAETQLTERVIYRFYRR